MGLHRNVKKTFHSKKMYFNEKHFSWIFLNDIFISGSTEDRWQKRRKIFRRNNFFHWNLLPLERFDWLGMIHQWVYTRMVIKKFSEKKFPVSVFIENSFFKKLFRLTLFSMGVWSTKIREWKTFCRVNFFRYGEVFSWKTYFEWLGKNYQRSYTGML